MLSVCVFVCAWVVDIEYAQMQISHHTEMFIHYL